MELNPREVYGVLIENSVDTLNHANSVITSCQFLRYGALISRGVIERKNWKQTAQLSDETDKEYSIWNDVFVDSVDIHERASRANAYGPVLIQLDPAILINQHTGNVWITKCNPTKWAAKKVQDRWFQSIEELKEIFCKGTFDHMIVFRHCGGELPIKGCVKQILLDDPLIEDGPNFDIYSSALGALRFSLEEGDIGEVPIKKRICKQGCKCTEYYNQNLSNMATMFAPWKLKKDK